jgi:redox-sensitive bicupin YhaK (pirin superfamily)
MSNTEKDPTEQQLCTEHGRPESQPAPDAEVELLFAREVPLGGPRAMLVRRALPNQDRRMVGAWCFADAYGPDDVSAGAGMQVPPHPHTGLQTVSWLVAGDVLHRDSLGSVQLVRPGSLNLMTAGHGIAHSEVSPPEHAPTLHGAQLWVALPDSDRHVEPAFETHSDLPRIEMEGGAITVIVGTLVGLTSPATAFTPLVGAELALDEAGRIDVPLDPAFEHAVLALGDGLVVDGHGVPSGAMLYVGPGRTSLEVAAGAEGTIALLLGGEPFEEELVMWWNFVGRTHDDIADARKAWQVERELAAADRVRFGFVDGHDGFTLPAPALPGVALKPRPRHRSPARKDPTTPGS